MRFNLTVTVPDEVVARVAKRLGSKSQALEQIKEKIANALDTQASDRQFTFDDDHLEWQPGEDPDFIHIWCKRLRRKKAK